MDAAALTFERSFSRLLSALQAGDPGDSGRSPGAMDVDQVRARDPESWRALYHDSRDDLYRYTLARLGSVEDAEDAVGEIFEEALASAHRLEDQGLPARAWLFGIARHVVGRRWRQRFRRPPHLALELFDGGALDPMLSPEFMDLARAIKRLPSRYAEVVTLRFFHGLSLAETAGALGSTVPAVKSLQFRAIQQLREELDMPLRVFQRTPLPNRE